MEAEEPRETIGGVLSTGIGLGVIFLSILGLGSVAMMTMGGEVDAEEKIGTLFKGGEVPFGLELTDASSFATGETLLRFERPAPAGEMPGEVAATSALSPDDPVLPDEIVLIEFASREQALAKFNSKEGGGPGGGQFGPPSDEGQASRGESARLLDWQRDPSFAWHTTVEGDEIGWSRWRAEYRIERSFREGGTWGDAARVDLSQEGRNLLLFALWPDGVAATKDGIHLVLRTIEMLETAE